MKNWKYYLSFIVIIPSVINAIDIKNDGSITITDSLTAKLWAAICLIVAIWLIYDFFKQMKRKRA